MKNELVQTHHLRRKAVIYIRQSTGHQVLTNQESQMMQRAMKDHALRLGWDDSSIEVVESDTGTSAQNTAGRRGYRNLLSELALGEIGIVLSYESTRLSRNCSDWYPLLDLCTLNQCLIGDRDGVYDPGTPNGRLLLGMKGIISELELHTLRGRLLAGIENKAQRGELALPLPTGYVRIDNGAVVKDPDLQVQETIGLVFSSFLELRSCYKVARHMRAHGLLLPRRSLGEPCRFRQATAELISSVLRNPTYAGAFAYGRTRSLRSSDPQRARPKIRRQAQDKWRVLLKDMFPAYIDWDTFERIQTMLTDNYATYDRRMSRGVPRDGAALLAGICYCGRCGRKMTVSYGAKARYECTFAHVTIESIPARESLPSDEIDECVRESFFAALSPVELDLYDAALVRTKEQQEQVRGAQERQLQRLRYEVNLARRQYDRADPDNRLVTLELERRWESALRELQQAEQRYEQDQREMQAEAQRWIPVSLRAEFSTLGQALPELWPRLPIATRKAMLRCLVDKVVLRRLSARDRVLVRVVWRGGAYTEKELQISVPKLCMMSSTDALIKRVAELFAQGQSDAEIAQQLTAEGFQSPMKQPLRTSSVGNLRRSQGQLRRPSVSRPRSVGGALTVGQMAKVLGVHRQWIYTQIYSGVIRMNRDPEKNLYLFPNSPETLSRLCQLRDGLILEVNLSKEHQDA